MALSAASKFWIASIGGGFGASLGLILMVLATGQTFGQRCAAVYASPAEKEACVQRLSEGRPLVVSPAAASAAPAKERPGQL